MRPYEAQPAVPYRNIAVRAAQPAHPMADPVSLGFDLSKDAQLFAELSKLTVDAPLEHYFSNLHRALMKVMNAQVMVVGIKDFAAIGGFKFRYRRDASHADTEPVIEQRFIDA